MSGKKRQINFVVSYKRKARVALCSPIKFEWSFRNCSPDKVTISDSEINISFERSSSTKPMNHTRINYLQLVAFLLACLEGAVEAPDYKTACCSTDGACSEPIELPDELRRMELGYSGTKFPYHVICKSLEKNELAKALRIAISYCWAAARAYSQEERLKLLWGSFNALYRCNCAQKNPEKKYMSERTQLDNMSKLLITENILNRALDVFEREIESKYKDFIRWKMLTSCSAIKLEKKEEKSAGGKRKRLHQIDKETLSYMRDCGCGNVKGKGLLKEEIDSAIASASVEKDKSRKIAMMLCVYIYLFRCDAVHANIEYPIFKTKTEHEKEILADLLEAAVVDIADWFSKEQA